MACIYQGRNWTVEKRRDLLWPNSDFGHKTVWCMYPVLLTAWFTLPFGLPFPGSREGIGHLGIGFSPPRSLFPLVGNFSMESDEVYAFFPIEFEQISSRTASWSLGKFMQACSVMRIKNRSRLVGAKLQIPGFEFACGRQSRRWTPSNTEILMVNRRQKFCSIRRKAVGAFFEQVEEDDYWSNMLESSCTLPLRSASPKKPQTLRTYED